MNHTLFSTFGFDQKESRLIFGDGGGPTNNPQKTPENVPNAEQNEKKSTPELVDDPNDPRKNADRNVDRANKDTAKVREKLAKKFQEQIKILQEMLKDDPDNKETEQKLKTAQANLDLVGQVGSDIGHLIDRDGRVGETAVNLSAKLNKVPTTLGEKLDQQILKAQLELKNAKTGTEQFSAAMNMLEPILAKLHAMLPGGPSLSDPLSAANPNNEPNDSDPEQVKLAREQVELKKEIKEKGDVATLETETKTHQKDGEAELAKLEPALIAAQAALPALQGTVDQLQKQISEEKDPAQKTALESQLTDARQKLAQGKATVESTQKKVDLYKKQVSNAKKKLESINKLKEDTEEKLKETNDELQYTVASLRNIAEQDGNKNAAALVEIFRFIEARYNTDTLEFSLSGTGGNGNVDVQKIMAASREINGTSPTTEEMGISLSGEMQDSSQFLSFVENLRLKLDRKKSEEKQNQEEGKEEKKA